MQSDRRKAGNAHGEYTCKIKKERKKKMKFEEIIKSMSGHEMTAEEINRKVKDAKETFGLTDEAEDTLKMLFLLTSKEYQDYIFKLTYKK